MEQFSPRRMIREALKSLDDELYELLCLHNRLNGKPGLSFEEISDQGGQSVDNLVFFEKKAIRKLRKPELAKVISKAIDSANLEIWNILSNNKNILYKNILSKQIVQLPGEYFIGIKCMYENVTQWLNQNAAQNKIAWFRSDYPARQVLKDVGRLKRFHKKRALPLPFSMVAEILDIDLHLLNQIAGLSRNKLGIYRDYIAMLPIASRTIRAIRIHLMLCYQKPGEIVTLEQLKTEYTQTYSDDNPTLKDIEWTMADNPHLFINLGRIGWVNILNKGGDNPYQKNTNILKKPDKYKYFSKKPWKTTQTISIIKEIVASKGLIRPREVALEFKKKERNNISERSIPAIIADSPEFIQVSPSVYALRNYLDNIDPITASTDYLLTVSDLRWYILSRYSGEPMDTFPLWTPAMEKKWCQWAEKNATNYSKKRLFRSLLHIAEPVCWPASDDEIKYWSKIRKWNSCYFHEFEPKHRIWDKIPPLQDIVRLAIYTCHTNSMNWIRANRAARYYLFDQHSVTLMAILIALDVVLPSGHWQNLHKIGPDAQLIREILITAAQQNISLDWNSQTGLEIRDKIRRIKKDKELGWVNAEDLSLLSKKLDGEDIDEQNSDIENKQKVETPVQLELPF